MAGPKKVTQEEYDELRSKNGREAPTTMKCLMKKRNVRFYNGSGCCCW